MKLTPQLEQQIELPHDLIVEYKKTLSWKIEDRELRDVHLLWTADDLPVAGSLAQTFPRPAWTAQVSSQCWTSDTFHAGIIALVGGLEPWMDYDFPIILGMSSSQLTSCPSFFRGVSSNHQPGHVVAIIWKISTAYKSPSLKMRQWFKIINPQSPSPPVWWSIFKLGLGMCEFQRQTFIDWVSVLIHVLIPIWRFPEMGVPPHHPFYQDFPL